MSEPTSKKMKTSEEGSVSDVINICENMPYDRVLIVGDKKFGVQSDKLIKRSEYFRMMFTGYFMEKNKNEVPINDVDPEHMQIVLNVFLKSEDVGITGDNLQNIIRLFVYFLATPFFFNFLVEEKVLEQFCPDELFPMLEEFPDLKHFLDKVHTEEFLAKLEANEKKGRKSTISARKFNIAALIPKVLELADKHSFSKLKDVVDAELASKFKLNTSSRPISVAKEFDLLMNKYQLPKLMKAKEDYVLETYIKSKFPIADLMDSWTPGMTRIQAILVTHHTEELNRIKQNSDTSDLRNLLGACKHLELMSLMSSVEEYCIEECQKIKNISARSEYLNLCKEYDLINLKTVLEKDFIEEFNKNKDTMNYETHRSLLGMYRHLPNVQTLMENYFILNSQNIAEKNAKLSIEELSYLAFDHKLPTLKNCALVVLVEKFKLDKDLSFVVGLLIRFDLPPLKEVVEEYLLDPRQPLEHDEIEKVIEKKGKTNWPGFGCFTGTIEKYLIHQFNANHNLNHIKLAFAHKFEEYKKCISEFLNTVSLDDPIMIAAAENILKLENKKKAFILESLLR